MIDEEIKEKVNKRQKNIYTNEDLSGYGYVKHGKVEEVQEWMSIEENKKYNDLKSPEQCRKGGKYYLKKQKYNHTGLQGERHKVRNKHGNLWRRFKNIIAPGSQIHHQWRKNSAGYDGVALVEKDQHQHGIIKPIVILEGQITLLTEAEVRDGRK